MKMSFIFPAYTEANHDADNFDRSEVSADEDQSERRSVSEASAEHAEATRRRLQKNDEIQSFEAEEITLAQLSSIYPPRLQARKRRMQQAFLVAQLNMLADMCFDRNYLTTEVVRKMVSFDMAVHCIQHVPTAGSSRKGSELVSVEDGLRRWNNVRSAFIRLVNCAYVDCVPQMHRRWGNLVHLFFKKNSDWNRIKAGKLAGLSWAGDRRVNVEEGSIALVGREQAEIVLLQQKMIEHLQTKSWSTVTEQFVRTILAMINFSFYDTAPAKLSEVMAVVSKRLEIDWTEAYNVSAHVRSKGSVLQTVRLKANHLHAHMKPPETQADHKHKTLAVHPFGDDSDDEHDDDEYASNKPKPSLWTSCFDAKRRKRALRVLDDWKTMGFIISVVFAAVIAGLIAPKPPIVCTNSVLGRCAKGVQYAVGVEVCYSEGHCMAREDNRIFCAGEGIESCTKGPLPTSPFYVFDMVCFSIFQLELLVRIWAVGNTVEFFANPYSTTDFIVQLLDIIVIFAGGLLGSLSGNTKILRMLRMARLARLLKVMRLMKKMRDEMLRQKEVPVWKLPEAYRTAIKEKLLAMTVMTKVVSRATELARSFKLRAFLEALMVHKPAAEKLSQGPVPFKDGLFGELNKAADQQVSTPILTGDRLVTTVAHLLMYEHTPLVQEALQLLMTVHTTRGALIDSALQSQLLWEPEEELLYKKITAAVDLITNGLDTFQLWGERQSTSTNSRFKAVTQALTFLEDQCQLQSPLWELGARKYTPVFEVQMIMQNLAVDVSFVKWRNALRWPKPEDTRSAAMRVRQLCALIYRVLICFVRNSPTNQAKTFNHLSIFCRDLRLGVPNAAEMIYELLLQNRELLRIVPINFVDDVFEIVEATQSATVMRLLAVIIPHSGMTKGMGIKVTRFLTDVNEKLEGEKDTCFFDDAIEYFKEQHKEITSGIAQAASARQQGNDSVVRGGNGSTLVCESQTANANATKPTPLSPAVHSLSQSIPAAPLSGKTCPSSTLNYPGGPSLEKWGTGPKFTSTTGAHQPTALGPSRSFVNKNVVVLDTNAAVASLESKLSPKWGMQQPRSPDHKQAVASSPDHRLETSVERAFLVTSETKTSSSKSAFGGFGTREGQQPAEAASLDTLDWVVKNEHSHLSSKLQYYIAGLDVLGLCAAGATNVVEARIQGVLDGDEVLDLMADTTGALPEEVRVSLAQVYFEAIMEVGVPIAGLGKNLKVSRLQVQ
jgi:hypothetical protein